MRTLILLTVVSAMVGCQHGQKCTQSYRSMSPFSGCNVRDAETVETSRHVVDLAISQRPVERFNRRVRRSVRLLPI